MDKWSSIEGEMEEIHGDSNIESILSENSMMEIEMRPPECEENATMNIELKEPKILKKFSCIDCGYLASRLNALSTHRAQHCKMRRDKGLLAEKKKQCKYCLKKMHHDALRSDLRHFIKMLESNRKPKNKHASISLEEFIDYLHEIKTSHY